MRREVETYLGGRHWGEATHLHFVIPSLKVPRAVVGSFKKPVADHVDGELTAVSCSIVFAP